LAQPRAHVGKGLARLACAPACKRMCTQKAARVGAEAKGLGGHHRGHLGGARTQPQVVHACALEFDLRVLHNGDAFMAGERGMNLSGGQRQRVGLARAAYHESQLVLLDNPLR